MMRLDILTSFLTTILMLVFATLLTAGIAQLGEAPGHDRPPAIATLSAGD